MIRNVANTVAATTVGANVIMTVLQTLKLHF